MKPRTILLILLSPIWLPIAILLALMGAAGGGSRSPRRGLT